MLRLAHREGPKNDKDILLDISKMCGEKTKNSKEETLARIAQNTSKKVKALMKYGASNKMRNKTMSSITPRGGGKRTWRDGE